MGDRGNIAVLYPPGRGETEPQIVYLYTHWGGADLGWALQDALRRSAPGADPEGEFGRSSDPAYLARIVFDSLKGGDVGGTTGYGIAPCVADNENPILAVDAERQQVYLVPRNASVRQTIGELTRSASEDAPRAERPSGLRRWALEQFIAADFDPYANCLESS